MKEKNRRILNKAIARMPVYRADDNLWDGISEQIYGGYASSVGNLPVFKAPESLWGQIDKMLDPPRNHQNGRMLRFTRIAAAATILLAVGAGLIYIILMNIDKNPGTIHTESLTEVSLLYNPSLCQGNPHVCNSPIFRELNRQLTEIKEELVLMEPIVNNEDPQMLKYYYRLENLRVEIEKKMVKMIIES
jgi:hypothetical protein